MAFSDCLRETSVAIAESWQRRALDAYPAASARAFHREQDPFANPVGHALRVATRAVVEGLAEGRGAGEMAPLLDAVVKIRAVQEFAPSVAIAFVFSLKGAVREVLGREGSVSEFSAELAALDQQIDQIALGVFDIYVRCREQIHAVKIDEIKRSVGRFWQPMHRRARRAEVEQEPMPPVEPSAAARRGDGS